MQLWKVSHSMDFPHCFLKISSDHHIQRTLKTTGYRSSQFMFTQVYWDRHWIGLRGTWIAPHANAYQVRTLKQLLTSSNLPFHLCKMGIMRICTLQIFVQIRYLLSIKTFYKLYSIKNNRLFIISKRKFSEIATFVSDFGKWFIISLRLRNCEQRLHCNETISAEKLPD